MRLRVFEYTLANNGGYLSQACSSAELLVGLYGLLMRLAPSVAPLVPPAFSGAPSAAQAHPQRGGDYNGPRAPHLDRFFFSPVHYSLVLYSVLIEFGRLSEGALDHFDEDGSTVEMIGAEHSPGIEVTAGSLAQTLSQAMGVALARKLRGEPGFVWVFMSDGEFQEGQTWEALAALAYHEIDNVKVVVDVNGQQCDGPMDGVMTISPIVDRARSFGATALEIDGHDLGALVAAANTSHPGGPLVIFAQTDPCRGIEVLRTRAPRFHYVRFRSDAERALFEDAYRELAADSCGGTEAGR